MSVEKPSAAVPPTPRPSRAHILCLAGPANLAVPAAAALRARFAHSHGVELLREPSDVSAVIRTLQRVGRTDGGEVEVIVVEAGAEDAAEAALLRAHWPAARWTTLGEPGTIPLAAGPPTPLPSPTLDALAGAVGAALDEYRRERSADLNAALARMELLRGLSPARLGWIAERIERRHYEAGEVIVRAGEPGDGVYFIRAGEVKVLDAEAVGHERVIVQRGRGEHFGELALLTGEPRSNTVVADLDSEIFFLPREPYAALMEAEASLGVHLSRVLSTRLARAHRRHRQTPRIIACCRTLTDDGGGAGARALAAAIAAETGRAVVLLELEATHPSAPRDALEAALRRLEDATALSRDDCLELGPGVWELAARRSETLRHLRRPQAVPALLDVLTQAFPFVVVGLGARTPPDVLVRTARQCDALLLHAGRDAEHARQGGEILTLLRRECPSVEAKLALAAEVPAAADVLGHAVDHRLPADPSGAERAYRRTARRLLGIGVGLALGGGGARGAAHLGVLQVLDDAGVPIDMIGATSAGAIVGGGIAMGRTVADAVDCWRRETVVNPVRSYTLSKTALFSDRRLEAMLRRLFGDLLIEHLPMPFFAMATDLNRAAAVPLDRGPLWLAVRASCALPGAVTPVRIGDAYLVDGGVANNVPSDVLRERGARFVIAVDVSRERGFEIGPDGENRQNWVSRGLRRIGRVREFLDAPSMVQVIMRAMEVQALQTVSARAWSWNVRIHPDVSAFSSLEFGGNEALMERGREAAAASLPEIKTGLAALLDDL
jgi:NTE family protein